MTLTANATILAGRIVSTGTGGWVVRCRNRCLTRAVPNSLNLSREELVRQLKRDGWSARGGYWTCPRCRPTATPPHAVEPEVAVV